MRILTRGDLDGMTSAVLLTHVEKITEIRFAHPKDVQDGKVPCTEEDIIVNLPHVPGCGMWFDHHVSEEEKLPEIGAFKGRFAVAPSAAHVIYEHYKHPDFERYRELLDATDCLDSAQLTKEDVTNPSGWLLLGLTLDPRSGLGPEFQKYFRWLVEYAKEVPIAKILQHPEVKKRCDRVLNEQEAFKKVLEKHSTLRGNVIVTDFRGVNRAEMPVGNRFLVFTMFPQGNVEARIFHGHDGQAVVVAAGHSIFNRTCKVNLGKLLSEYGGGGHAGAGTAQLPGPDAEAKLEEILGRLQEREAAPALKPDGQKKRAKASKPRSKPKAKGKAKAKRAAKRRK